MPPQVPKKTSSAECLALGLRPVSMARSPTHSAASQTPVSATTQASAAKGQSSAVRRGRKVSASAQPASAPPARWASALVFRELAGGSIQTIQRIAARPSPTVSSAGPETPARRPSIRPVRQIAHISTAAPFRCEANAAAAAASTPSAIRNASVSSSRRSSIGLA